ARPVLGGGDCRHFIHVRYPPNQAIRKTTATSSAISGQAVIRLMCASPCLKSQRSQKSWDEAPFSAFQRLRNRRFDLGDGEGLAADLRQRLGVDQELVAKQGLELAGVHLRHEDILEALE